jgi:hypothetical protein
MDSIGKNRGGHRQQGDLISLLTKIRVDMQTDGQTQVDAQTARRSHASFCFFFKIRKVG